VDEVHSCVIPKFQDKVDFLTVYLKEAHPSDIWPLGQHVCVESHKTIKDRIVAATKFVTVSSWRLPVVVDTLQDMFMNTYCAHPERFYVIVNGKLAFKAKPQNAYYPISDLVAWLNSYFCGE